jgi:dihydroneopterin aldolase
MESDAILLRSFRVMAYCGVLDEEQARRQPFEINAEVFADLRAAGQSDDLNDTINYGVLGEKIAELVEKSRFALLEYFAQQIADLLGRPDHTHEELTCHAERFSGWAAILASG